jgi:hypothetical protein
LKVSLCKGRLRGIFNPVQRDFDETLRLQVAPVRSRFQLPIGQELLSGGLKRFEQERILLKKESESERRLAELQIQALQDQLARQSAEIEKQRAQVEDAKRQVQDIAIKAIEGASGAQALSHIDKIAMEQAKNPRTSKLKSEQQRQPFLVDRCPQFSL